MHPAVERATDSDEPRTRCLLVGLAASYGTAASRAMTAGIANAEATHRDVSLPDE
jgi:hypothetical protein